jgi:hypothetical protein
MTANASISSMQKISNGRRGSLQLNVFSEDANDGALHDRSCIEQIGRE